MCGVASQRSAALALSHVHCVYTCLCDLGELMSEVTKQSLEPPETISQHVDFKISWGTCPTL